MSFFNITKTKLIQVPLPLKTSQVLFIEINVPLIRNTVYSLNYHVYSGIIHNRMLVANNNREIKERYWIGVIRGIINVQ